jgi:hypothetical protein
MNNPTWKGSQVFIDGLSGADFPNSIEVNYNGQYAGVVEKLAGKPYILVGDGSTVYLTEKKQRFNE